MVFSSYVFLFVFLPLAIGSYYALGWAGSPGKVRAARSLLLVALSYLFYGWERYAYVGLIVFSTVVDLACASAISRSGSGRRRKAILGISIATNLGLLGFFKYRNFALGIAGMPPVLEDLVLPVGISFYTFQSMSYTIDVYRGVVTPIPGRRAVDFFAYVALFPQLVAGPIVRYSEIADQLVERTHTLTKVGRGAFFFMVGFAKKTLIANNVAYLADGLFANEQVGLADAWVGMLAYAMQIYFDFSGYSDMAIGLGLMIGFRFPINFDSPYKAESITDFWRRWHITLSRWLRDYLYVPLGGNRGSKLLTYRNLFLTMLLGGLWHGAAWTFVAWGAWHGGLLALERALGKRSLYARAPLAVRRAVTFALVLMGWVLFRAGSFPQALDIFSSMFSGALDALDLRSGRPATLPLFALAAGSLIAFFGTTTQDLARRIGPVHVACAWAAFVLGIQQMLQTGFNPFIYFQF